MERDRYRHDFKRARSEAEKESRRRDILAAARAQLAGVGVESFSMVPLAKEAGVARGTLYLYFPTREELLLALYLEEIEAWIAELEPLVPSRMDAQDFLRVVYTSATARPIFLSLAAQVTNVIEKNVSTASLAESKRYLAHLVEAAGRCTAHALGQSLEDGTEVAVGLFTLLIGVTVAFGGPQVSSALPGPLERERPATPEEPVDVFLRLGRWLIAGANPKPFEHAPSPHPAA